MRVATRSIAPTPVAAPVTRPGPTSFHLGGVADPDVWVEEVVVDMATTLSKSQRQGGFRST